MKKIPEIKPGDFVKVYSKLIEGDKERIAPFQGVVLQIKGHNTSKTFTVRKVSAGVGVERIFPLYSPLIIKIEVKKKGKVRRAKLTYLRNKKVKKMKMQETELEMATPPEETTEKPAPKAEKKTKKNEGEKVEGAPGAKTVEKV